mgnify:CR=1 FL=1
MRNCLLEEDQDDRLQKINLAIADEDIAIVKELYPVRTPETSTKEILIVGDECISEFRTKLKTWEKMGWRIDTKTLSDNEDDVAYAIPCPGRRTSKNWVMDPVPIMDT